MSASPAPSVLRALRPDSLVVVGQDDLGVEVCRRLVAANRSVVALWPEQSPQLDDLDKLGLERIVGDVRRPEVLTRAGVHHAETVLAITKNDELNLLVALAARDLNPKVRIVLRQFNRRLGQKITQQLANTDAVSPETYSAATYAASCLNRSVYHALEFPRYSERLVVFCRGTAGEFGVAGQPVGDIEHRRGWKVLAVDDERFPPFQVTPDAEATLTISASMSSAPVVAPLVGEAELGRSAPAHAEAGLLHRLRHIHVDPVLVTLIALLIAMLLSSIVYFRGELALGLVDAVYFVVSTATHTGFGDINLLNATNLGKIAGVGLMLGSVAITGVLLAYLTAAITRRSLEFAQGRYPARGRDHIVVCGFGNVGSRIVSYLLHEGRQVVVIDRAPVPALAGEARARGAHIITADATSEVVLGLAGVSRASALLAVTDSDSANFEIALTALAYAPSLPVVMRIAEHATAKAVERHFRIRASYSAAELAAPLVTGLAIERGARGTIDVAGRHFTLFQRPRMGAPVRDQELLLAAHDDLVLVLRM